MLFSQPILTAAAAAAIPLLLLSQGEVAARRLIDTAINVQAGHSFDAAVAPQVRAVLAAPGSTGGSPSGAAFVEEWLSGLDPDVGASVRAVSYLSSSNANRRPITFHRPPNGAIRWPTR